MNSAFIVFDTSSAVDFTIRETRATFFDPAAQLLLVTGTIIASFPRSKGAFARTRKTACILALESGSQEDITKAPESRSRFRPNHNPSTHISFPHTQKEKRSQHSSKQMIEQCRPQSKNLSSFSPFRKSLTIGNRVVKSLDCREANNSRLLFRSLSLNLFLALQPS